MVFKKKPAPKGADRGLTIKNLLGVTIYMTVVTTTDTVAAVAFAPALVGATVELPPPPKQAARIDKHPIARAMSSIFLRFMVYSSQSVRISAIVSALKHLANATDPVADSLN
jgi:hypothetical protein